MSLIYLIDVLGPYLLRRTQGQEEVQSQLPGSGRPEEVQRNTGRGVSEPCPFFSFFLFSCLDDWKSSKDGLLFDGHGPHGCRSFMPPMGRA